MCGDQKGRGPLNTGGWCWGREECRILTQSEVMLPSWRPRCTRSSCLPARASSSASAFSRRVHARTISPLCHSPSCPSLSRSSRSSWFSSVASSCFLSAPPSLYRCSARTIPPRSCSQSQLSIHSHRPIRAQPVLHPWTTLSMTVPISSLLAASALGCSASSPSPRL